QMVAAGRLAETERREALDAFTEWMQAPDAVQTVHEACVIARRPARCCIVRTIRHARRALAAIASAWLLLLGTAFFLNRGEDAGRLAGLLRDMLGSLARDRLVSASGVVAGAGGLFIAAVLVLAWFGLGDLLLRLGRGGRDSLEAPPRTLALASRCLFGAAAWSMV